MSGHIKELAEESFHSDVAQGLVLVDFYADWCGPCRMMAPILEKIADEMTGHVIVAKLDIDQAQKVAGGLQITSIPTLILFQGGKEVGRLVGLRDAEAIKDFIKSGSKK